MEARMQSNAFFPGAAKLIVGIFFALLGLLLTADNLALVDAGDFLPYWPVVLILVGAVKLLEPGGSRIFGGGLVIVGAGLLADRLGYISFDLFDLWPLLLIVAGGILVARAVGVVPDQGIPNWAIFTNRTVRETSREYRGAKLVATLGGYELDLTGADIAQSPAVIDAFAFWGAIEITVPDGWEVVGEVMPFMAGFDVRTSAPPPNAKRLIIRGTAVMAGIEVKSAPRRMS